MYVTAWHLANNLCVAPCLLLAHNRHKLHQLHHHSSRLRTSGFSSLSTSSISGSSKYGCLSASLACGWRGAGTAAAC